MSTLTRAVNPPTVKKKVAVKTGLIDRIVTAENSWRVLGVFFDEKNRWTKESMGSRSLLLPATLLGTVRSGDYDYEQY